MTRPSTPTSRRMGIRHTIKPLERMPKGWPRELIGPDEYLTVTNPGVFDGTYRLEIDVENLTATITEEKS